MDQQSLQSVRFLPGHYGRLAEMVSQAAVGAEFVFVGSQTPHRPEDGRLVRGMGDLPRELASDAGAGMVIADIPEDRIRAQTRCALDHIAALLTEAGSSVERIVHLRLFLRDTRDLASAAEVVHAVLGENTPATTIVETARPGVDSEIDVQIDAVAALSSGSFTPEHISVPELVQLLWPFPSATCYGPLVFTTPVPGVDPATGRLASRLDDLTAEERALAEPHYANPRDAALVAEHLVMWRNIKSILAAADVPFENVLHQNNWLRIPMQQYVPVTRVRRRLFGLDAARTAATSLPISGLRTPGAAYEGSIIGVRKDGVQHGFSKEIRLESHGVGPYYLGAVKSGPYVFAAGEVPIRSTGDGPRMIAKSADALEGLRFLQFGRVHSEIPLMVQADTVYELIRDGLAAYGCDFADVVHQTVYLVDPIEYPALERIATLYFGTRLPPTTIVPIVGASPFRETLLEIEVTAIAT